MASLCHLWLSVEASSETPNLLLCVNNRRPEFSCTAFFGRSSLSLGGNTFKLKSLKLAEDDDFASSGTMKWKCRGKAWKAGRNRRRSRTFAAREDDADDAIQAARDKTKKVLAMQKNLLQQIAEKRKLVSSIKNSPITEEAMSEDGSSPKADLSSAGEDPDQDYGDGTFSTNIPQSTAVETQEFLRVRTSVSTASIEVVEEELKSSTVAKVPLAIDSSELLKKRSESVVPSATLSKSFQSYGAKEEKFVELEEADAGVKVGEQPDEEEAKLPPLAGTNVMNVIIVALECTPWSKTGGLGDVAGALPKALARRGHRVMVFAPRYGDYREAQAMGVCKRYKVEGQDHEVNYYQAYIDGVDFVFVDSPMFRHRENNIYGGRRLDVLKRMILFCKAAVEVPWHVPCGGVCYGDGNLVFIANDWHTALLPVYLKAYYRDQGMMKYTRSVLVIHNIAHQGRGPVDDFNFVDLPEHYKELFTLYDPIGGDHFNIFAAGLKTADRIVSVSCGYARELKTSEGGWGLHNIINENDWKLRGIVNGIDTKEWNPEVDVHLTTDGYTNYSLETLKTGKAQCKQALQKELGLPEHPDVPLIGFIGRLDPQKGMDLIAEAIPWMLGQDVQLVMLGSGRPDLERMLRHFESQHHDKVRGWVGFSVKTAHRITAGADILLMPSRFEPCGLNQLYAMMYGTVPVVHAVGGLRDTVQPFDPYNESGLGWTFDKAEAGRLIHALGNCLFTYRDYTNSWEGIQRRGMMQDLSWDNAARQYEEVLVAAKYQW